VVIVLSISSIGELHPADGLGSSAGGQFEEVGMLRTSSSLVTCDVMALGSKAEGGRTGVFSILVGDSGRK